MRTKKLIRQLVIPILALALLLCGALCLAVTASAEGAQTLPDESSSVELKDSDADGFYEIGTAKELYAFANLVNAGNNDIKAKLTADIDLNPGYTFTFIPDTGLIEVKKETSVIGYLGTGINGDQSGSNIAFDTMASVKGTIYANADDAIADRVDAFDGIRTWTPIGKLLHDDDSNPIYDFTYQGIFNGDGHTVSGLYFNDPDAANVGLFGYSIGQIKGVGLANFYIKADAQLGAIVGYNHGGNVGGIVDQCFTAESGIVIGDENQVGGVVGANFGGTIKNCYNRAHVVAPGGVGGLVGYMFVGELSHSYTIGPICGEKFSGKIVGSNFFATINNSYYLATSTSEYGRTATEFSNGTVAAALNKGQDSAVWGQLIGLDPYPLLNHFPTLTTDKYDLNDDGTKDEVYEIATADQLYWFAAMVNGSPNAVPEITKPLTNAYAVLTADIDLNPGYTFTFIPDTGLVEVKHKTDGIIGYLGTGMRGDPDGNNYFFDAVHEGYKASARGATYSDPENINSCSISAFDNIRTWTPIVLDDNGYGCFDGNGYTISGLYFNDNEKDYVGLFGCGWGIFKNIGVINSYLCGRSSVGAIVGTSGSLSAFLENCYNTGVVCGYENVGGLGGFVAKISKCYNTGIVSGNEDVGGLAGELYNTFGSTSIQDSYNEGNVCGDFGYTGGIVGFFKGSTYDSTETIKGCYNTGNISSMRGSLGGIIGSSSQSNNMTIENCSNDGDITVYDSENEVEFVGGILGSGYYSKIKITDSKNTGKINDPSNNYNPTCKYVGGILGGFSGTTAEGDIDNCSNSGIVYGGSYTGGILGGFSGTDAKGDIDNCSNSGKVHGNSDAVYAGGIAGKAKTVQNCSNSGKVHGNSYTGGIAGWAVTIENCANSGAIFGSGQTGGIVGWAVTIENCANSGAIDGADSVGGIAGAVEESIIGCYNSGSIGSYGSCGGIVGKLVGEGASVSFCYNEGDIDTTGSTGGIVGYSDAGKIEITNCYNVGDFGFGHRSYSCGGIAGNLVGSDNRISNCHNYGQIIGSFYIGGLVGNFEGTFENCYYLEGCAKDQDDTVQNAVGTQEEGSVTPDGEGVFAKTAEEFLSGEVAYLLQANQTENVWGQILRSDGLHFDFDLYPVFRLPDNSNQVFRAGLCTNPTSFSNLENNYIHDITRVEADAFEHQDGSMVCTICKAIAVASVTNVDDSLTYYTTLAQAISVAEENENSILTVLEHITIEEDHQINKGVFTFDLNGKDITNLNNATLRFVNGTVTMTDDSEALGKVSAQIVVDGGTRTLIIEDGEFMDVLVNRGSLTVTGGDFFDLDHVGGTLTITGGSYDKLYVGEQGILTDVSSDGFYFYQSNKLVDFTDLLKPYVLANVTVRQGLDENNAVAKVGEILFADLKSAIAYANEFNGGAVVTLLKDITLSETLTISNDITLKGRHVITRGTSRTLFAVTEDATFTLDGGIVIDGNNKWTFNADGYYEDLKANLADPVKDGSADQNYGYSIPQENGLTSTASLVSITEGGRLVLNEVIVENNFGNSLFAVPKGATLTINEGTLIQNIRGRIVNELHGSLTMNGGKIKGVHLQNGDGGIIGDLYGTFTINGGEIYNNTLYASEKYGNGILAHIRKGGSLIINDGHIHDNAAFVSNSSQNTARGGLIYFNYYDDHIKSCLEMNGGIIENTLSNAYTVLYANWPSIIRLNGGTINVDKSFGNSYDSILWGEITIGKEMNLSGGTIAILDNGVDHVDCKPSLTVNGTINSDLLFIYTKWGGKQYLSVDQSIAFGESGVINGNVYIKHDGTQMPIDKLTALSFILDQGVWNGDLIVEGDVTLTVTGGTFKNVCVKNGAVLTVQGGTFDSLTVEPGATLTNGTDSGYYFYQNGSVLDVSHMYNPDITYTVKNVGASFGADLADADMQLGQTEYTYNGADILPSLTVTVGGRTLIPGEDYTVIYESNRNAGTARVVVKAIGNTYTGERVLSFVINPLLLSDCTVELSSDSLVYNGEDQIPEIKIFFEQKLVEDLEYVLTFPTDTKNVGVKVIAVSGNYVGRILYEITEKPIETSDVQDLDEKIAALEEQIGKGNQTADQIIVDIQEIIKEIERLETNTKDDLTGAIDQAKADVVAAYEAALNEAIKELSAADSKTAEDITTATEELKALIEAAEDYAETQDTALKTELTEKISEASESLLELIKKVQENLDDAKDALDKAIADGDKALDEKITNLNKALEDAKAAAEASDEALKTELTEKIEKADDALAEAIEKVQENLDNAKEELDKAIADGDKALDEKIDDLREALRVAEKASEAADKVLRTELINRIEESTTILTESIHVVQENLENAREELNNAILAGDAELDQKIENLNEALDVLEAAYPAADEALKAELLSQMREADDVLAKAVVQVQQNLDDAMAEIAERDKVLRNLVTISIIFGILAVFGNFVLMAWGIVGKSKK